jgi:hypothetical protein
MKARNEELQTSCVAGEKVDARFDMNGSKMIYKTSGGFVLRTEVFEDHPWKGYGFAPTYKTIPESEATAMMEMWRVEREETATFQAAKLSDEELQKSYLAALPAEIAGFYRGVYGCCRLEELTDDIGNYVMSIPKKAARENWDIDKLSAYIEAETAEGWGE